MYCSLPFNGSTSRFYKLPQDKVVKSPADQPQRADIITSEFDVERQLLEMLGTHPRIVRYFGWHADPEGLTLAEASEGNLQQYLEQHKKIPMSTRRKWCQQVVQSISYIHSRGVIHSDLRPENFLVHATTPESLDLWLCDFGGSFCKRLDLDGGHLPDSGFMDSKAPAVSEIYTDIFSIGSILYTIVTGHWPHGERSHLDKTPESMAKYCEHVNNIFGQGHFPETQGISGGSSILGCWTYMYATADEILKDLGMDDTKASASDIFELKPYT